MISKIMKRDSKVCEVWVNFIIHNFIMKSKYALS